MANKSSFSPLFTIFVVVIIIVLLYAGIAKADTAVIKNKNGQDIELTEVCLGGNLFLVTSRNGYPANTIQIMRQVRNRPSFAPVTCTAFQSSNTNFIRSGQE